MTEAGHADLHRDMGRLEGEFAGMKSDIAEIKELLKDISARLTTIEATESERKGAWWTLVMVATAIGAIAGTLLSHVWK